MALHPAAFGGCILACLLAASACGSSSTQPAAAQAARVTPVTAATEATGRSACVSGSAFELSLVSDRGGQPTPAAAAAWFARHGGVRGVPARGCGKPAAMAATRPSNLARSHSTSSKDPTGHGRSTAAAGVPDSCGTPDPTCDRASAYRTCEGGTFDLTSRAQGATMQDAGGLAGRTPFLR
jgi:hypothetical protein